VADLGETPLFWVKKKKRREEKEEKPAGQEKKKTLPSPHPLNE